MVDIPEKIALSRKFVILSFTLMIALILLAFFGIEILTVILWEFGAIDISCATGLGGLQFDEQYNESDQEYEVKIYIPTTTAENFSFLVEGEKRDPKYIGKYCQRSGIESIANTDDGRIVKLENLQKGQEIILEGKFEDGDEQLVDRYVVGSK